MENTSFELTLEQQFQMRLMEEAAQELNCDQLKELLLQSSKLLMVKDNVIRDLVRKVVLQPMS